MSTRIEYAADQPPSFLARWASRIAVFCVLLLVATAFLHRVFALPTPVALNMAVTAFAGAGLALLMAVIAALDVWVTGRQGAARVVTALAISLGLLALPAALLMIGRDSPNITDVTTDTEHPPEFAAVLETRPADANSLDYGGESVDQFLDVCGSQAKPFPLIGNVLGMAALYQAIGAEDIRVVLDGSGGDEIFGGYWQRYAGFAMRDAARADDRAWLDEVRASGFLPASLAQLSDRAIATDAPPTPSIDALDARDQSLLSKEGQEGLLTAESCDPLVNFDGTLTQALALDARAGRMQEWLWQNDRNAMAASVENRSPFLDHRLAHFVNTPYRAKIGGRWNKLELRRLFERFTPLPTATRADKQGFRWVYGRFLRNNRARIVELIRASTIARQFVDLDRCLASDIDDQAFLESRLVQRLLPIAGLEAAGGLA